MICQVQSDTVVVMTESQKPIFRSQMAEIAGITPVQLDYLVRLGIVAPDLGKRRKGFSMEEARITAGAAAFLRLGLAPASLAGPFKWLREQISADPKCMVRWDIAINGPMTDLSSLGFSDFTISDFWFAIVVDENHWQAHWNNTGAPVEGAEACSMINFRTVWKNRGLSADANNS